MNVGKHSKKQIQVWVANRFYYQKSIPLKDAAILSNCPEIAVRRIWIQRILDHDGTSDGLGGIEDWLKLAETVGLSREEVLDERHIVPGVRFSVDAYVNFARTRPWTEAVAASLTELLAPDLWNEAPMFTRFRGTDWMPEPCRSCPRQHIDFGGCRCQAFQLTGDATATDPVCHLSPHHALVEEALLTANRESAVKTEFVYRHNDG